MAKTLKTDVHVWDKDKGNVRLEAGTAEGDVDQSYRDSLGDHVWADDSEEETDETASPVLVPAEQIPETPASAQDTDPVVLEVEPSPVIAPEEETKAAAEAVDESDTQDDEQVAPETETKPAKGSKKK